MATICKAVLDQLPVGYMNGDKIAKEPNKYKTGYFPPLYKDVIVRVVEKE